MSLENLKSAFGNIELPDDTSLSSLNSDLDISSPQQMTLSRPNPLEGTDLDDGSGPDFAPGTSGNFTSEILSTPDNPVPFDWLSSLDIENVDLDLYLPNGTPDFTFSHFIDWGTIGGGVGTWSGGADPTKDSGVKHYNFDQTEFEESFGANTVPGRNLVQNSGFTGNVQFPITPGAENLDEAIVWSTINEGNYTNRGDRFNETTFGGNKDRVGLGKHGEDWFLGIDVSTGPYDTETYFDLAKEKGLVSRRVGYGGSLTGGGKLILNLGQFGGLTVTWTDLETNQNFTTNGAAMSTFIVDPDINYAGFVDAMLPDTMEFAGFDIDTNAMIHQVPWDSIFGFRATADSPTISSDPIGDWVQGVLADFLGVTHTTIPTYEKTVWDRYQPHPPTDSDAPTLPLKEGARAPDNYDNKYRGVAFQVLGPQNNPYGTGVFPMQLRSEFLFSEVEAKRDHYRKTGKVDDSSKGVLDGVMGVYESALQGITVDAGQTFIQAADEYEVQGMSGLIPDSYVLDALLGTNFKQEQLMFNKTSFLANGLPTYLDLSYQDIVSVPPLFQFSDMPIITFNYVPIFNTILDTTVEIAGLFAKHILKPIIQPVIDTLTKGFNFIVDNPGMLAGAGLMAGVVAAYGGWEDGVDVNDVLMVGIGALAGYHLGKDLLGDFSLRDIEMKFPFTAADVWKGGHQFMKDRGWIKDKKPQSEKDGLWNDIISFKIGKKSIKERYEGSGLQTFLDESWKVLKEGFMDVLDNIEFNSPITFQLPHALEQLKGIENRQLITMSVNNRPTLYQPTSAQSYIPVTGQDPVEVTGKDVKPHHRFFKFYMKYYDSIYTQVAHETEDAITKSVMKFEKLLDNKIGLHLNWEFQAPIRSNSGVKPVMGEDILTTISDPAQKARIRYIYRRHGIGGGEFGPKYGEKGTGWPGELKYLKSGVERAVGEHVYTLEEAYNQLKNQRPVEDQSGGDSGKGVTSQVQGGSSDLPANLPKEIENFDSRFLFGTRRMSPTQMMDMVADPRKTSYQKKMISEYAKGNTPYTNREEYIKMLKFDVKTDEIPDRKNGLNLDNIYYNNKVLFYPQLPQSTTTAPSFWQSRKEIKYGKSVDEAFSGTSKNIKGKEWLESSMNGMPFYFKDLRDNKYVLFRAYISDINENISPNWSETSFVGRSEPVYSYVNTSRDINFTLRLAAGNSQELEMIYHKMNLLSSMCYPQYKQDPGFHDSSRQGSVGMRKSRKRMKSPFVQLRIGELYGSEGKEMTGFLQSINYNVPDEATWETVRGARVPKMVDVTIAFKVTHLENPDMYTEFFGYYSIDPEELHSKTKNFNDANDSRPPGEASQKSIQQYRRPSWWDEHPEFDNVTLSDDFGPIND